MHKSLIIVPVWGKEYTDCAFLGLFAGLRQGRNIEFARQNDVRIALVTIDATSADYLRLQFERAPELEFTVYVIKSSGAAARHDYQKMIDCTNYGIDIAIREGRNAIFVNPDSVFNDGFLWTIHGYLDSGMDAVVVLGLRVIKEQFIRMIRANSGFSFSARELISFSLNNLHPISASHFWIDGRASVAMYLWWAAEKSCLIGRAFHFHPLIVSARCLAPGLAQTIDHEYVQQCVIDFKRVKVISDSNEIIGVELSREAYSLPDDLTKVTLDENVKWALTWTNDFRRRYYQAATVFWEIDEKERRNDIVRDIISDGDRLGDAVTAEFRDLSHKRMRIYDPEGYVSARFGASDKMWDRVAVLFSQLVRRRLFGYFVSTLRALLPSWVYVFLRWFYRMW